MIDVSDEFRAAITADARRILLRAVVDIISPDIVFGTATGSPESDASDSAQLHDKMLELGTPYATLETSRWLLDGSFPLAPPASGTQVGYESENIFDENGEGELFVQLNFSGVSILQACSVYFPGSDYDGFPVDFTVAIYQGATVVYTQTYAGYADRSVHLKGFTVSSPTGIRLTVTRWSLPSRRLRVPEIVPGIYELWDGGMLAEFSVVQQTDFSGLSLPYGTCHLQVDNTDGRFSPRNKDGLFQSLEERQGIQIMVGPSGAEMAPLGVFYQYSGGWTTSNSSLTMNWELVDIIGLLANRVYSVPATLPTTLGGWIASLTAQLGTNFAGMYELNGVNGSTALTTTSEKVSGVKCGQLLLWLCQAARCFPRAAAETGKLTLSALWNDGNDYTLDNLEALPVLKANKDTAFFRFQHPDGTETVVPGTDPASPNTMSINNPFITTSGQAQAAAAWMAQFFGGALIETTGRGDPSSEIGDAATVEFAPGDSETGRISYQTFEIQSGVLQKCKTRLLRLEVIGT